MDWTKILYDLLYAVITAVVPIITYYLVKFLKASFHDISTSTEQLVIHDTIDQALEVVVRVVSSVSQTYVDTLKSKGEFTKEAQAEAFLKAKETITEMLSIESQALLTTIYGDLDKWLEVQIEAAVKDQKIILKEGDK